MFLGPGFGFVVARQAFVVARRLAQTGGFRAPCPGLPCPGFGQTSGPWVVRAQGRTPVACPGPPDLQGQARQARLAAAAQICFASRVARAALQTSPALPARLLPGTVWPGARVKPGPTGSGSALSSSRPGPGPSQPRPKPCFRACITWAGPLVVSSDPGRAPARRRGLTGPRVKQTPTTTGWVRPGTPSSGFPALVRARDPTFPGRRRFRPALCPALPSPACPSFRALPCPGSGQVPCQPFQTLTWVVAFPSSPSPPIVGAGVALLTPPRSSGRHGARPPPHPGQGP